MGGSSTLVKFVYWEKTDPGDSEAHWVSVKKARWLLRGKVIVTFPLSLDNDKKVLLPLLSPLF